jgi:hypothetical protein
MFSPTLIIEARFGLSNEHTNRSAAERRRHQRPAGRYGILGIPQVEGNGGLPALRPSGLTSSDTTAGWSASASATRSVATT